MQLGDSIPVAPSTTALKIKFMQFNVENLFLYLERLDPKQEVQKLNEDQWQKLTEASVSNKPLLKTARLAEAIKNVDADVVMLNEVGGLESLENFNRLFLDSKYACHLIEGNSKRGIDVGYLVHSRLNLNVLLTSHRNRSINLTYPYEANETPKKAHLFSRDVAELRFFKTDPQSPFLICLLTHLKSKLDPDNIDPGGKIRRKAELSTLLQIYKEVKSDFPQAGVIVAGDFNGQAIGEKIEPEFSIINQETDLLDSLSLAGITGVKTYTQYQFPRYGSAYGLQLDYIWLSKSLENNLVKSETYVYRFKNADGSDLPLPSNSEQVYNLPSDHYPVVATFVFNS
jgi:endonuclease/exonuclease/phosphatase family metal-dependent hydrolase